jgi:hypothetical protein
VIASIKRLPKPALYGGGTVAAAIIVGAVILLTRPGAGVADKASASAKPAFPAMNLPTFAGPDAALNGSLEKQDENGNVVGWFAHDRFKPFVQIVNEDGNHFMRLTNEDRPRRSSSIRRSTSIQPGSW